VEAEEGPLAPKAVVAAAATRGASSGRMYPHFGAALIFTKAAGAVIGDCTHHKLVIALSKERLSASEKSCYLLFWSCWLLVLY